MPETGGIDRAGYFQDLQLELTKLLHRFELNGAKVEATGERESIVDFEESARTNLVCFLPGQIELRIKINIPAPEREES